MRPTRRFVLAAGLAPLLGRAAAAGEGWYPLRDGEGREVMNFRMPVEIETDIADLNNGLAMGAEDADLTVTEVYDSNCGYCRRAAREVKAMAAADPSLRVRLVNAPSLGLGSFQAAKVEYAVKRLGGEAKALALFEASMAARGVFDGRRALGVAGDLGLDVKDVERLADAAETGAVVAEAVRLANNANLAATPSWLIAGVALIGWPGRASLEAAIRAVRECDKPVCG